MAQEPSTSSYNIDWGSDDVDNNLCEMLDKIQRESFTGNKSNEI